MQRYSEINKQIKSTLSSIKNNVSAGVKSLKWSDRPQQINFEITSICDSKCIHCPRQNMERPMRPMDFELFKKMVDEAAEMQVPDLCPNGYGEILTMRNLEDYLDYISSKTHKFRLVINTNGYKLSDEKIELFIKHKIHMLNIMIDGATPETAEAIRIGLETPVIEDNIYRLMAIRKERNLSYPKVRVGMVLIPQNQHEESPFLKKWEGLVDYVGLSGFSNRSGSLNEKFNATDSSNNTHACVLPFQELNIWADGKAVLCCEDWNEEYVVGDLSKESLKDIWHGTALTQARKLHIQGRGADIEICKKCNFWRTPHIGTKLWS